MTQWTEISRFWIPGIPKPQPRPRAFSRGGVARVYDPGTAEAWKGELALAFREKYRHPKISQPTPIKLDIDFYMPRPKNLCRKRDPEGIIPHTKKPDRDNLEKATLDALTHLQLWDDDSQVCAGEVRKFYHNKTDGKPGAWVRISIPADDNEATN